MMRTDLGKAWRHPATWLALAALVIALAQPAAAAVRLGRNSVSSRNIVNGSVRVVDLAPAARPKPQLPQLPPRAYSASRTTAVYLTQGQPAVELVTLTVPAGKWLLTAKGSARISLGTYQVNLDACELRVAGFAEASDTWYADPHVTDTLLSTPTSYLLTGVVTVAGARKVSLWCLAGFETRFDRETITALEVR